MQLLPPHARRQATAIVAVLALLCAQAIALAHAVAHPRAQAGSMLASSAQATKAPGLFGLQHDEGSLPCQVLDQLSHGSGPAAPLPEWSFAAPEPAFVAAPAAVVHATCARGYHARGPPSFLA